MSEGRVAGREAVPNVMTVDVEDYFHVSAFESNIDRSQWANLPCRVEANTHRLLDMMDEKNIRATYFVLGWVAERYPALVREIAARGHEVACHGYSHKLIFNQSQEEFRQETARAKALLEDQVGSPMLGYRAASYSITRASLWALDVLVEQGFKYDSSIFPVRHDRYGIPDADPLPHVARAPSGGSIVEFPLSSLPLMGYRLPVAGGGYFRIYPFWFTRAALARVRSVTQAPFVFYLHPWEVDPEQPRVPGASLLSRFRHYHNLGQCEARLRGLIDRFPFAPMGEVLQSMGFQIVAKESA